MHAELPGDDAIVYDNELPVSHSRKELFLKVCCLWLPLLIGLGGGVSGVGLMAALG